MTTLKIAIYEGFQWGVSKFSRKRIKYKGGSDSFCSLWYIIWYIYLLWRKAIFRTNNIGKFSVTISVIESWNKMESQMGEIALKDLRPSKIKWFLTDKFIKNY